MRKLNYIVAFGGIIIILVGICGINISAFTGNYFTQNTFNDTDPIGCHPNFILDTPDADNNWRLTGGNTTAKTDYSAPIFTGIFNATDSFTNNSISDFTVVSGSWNIKDAENHDNVLYESGVGSQINKSIPRTVSGNFNVSFWYIREAGYADATFVIGEGWWNGPEIYIGINIQYAWWDSTIHFTTMFAPAQHVWYYFELEINCDAHQYSVWVNGTRYANMVNYNNVPLEWITILNFNTALTTFDAIDISCDPTFYWHRNYVEYSYRITYVSGTIGYSTVFGGVAKEYCLNQWKIQNYKDFDYLDIFAETYAASGDLKYFAKVLGNNTVILGGGNVSGYSLTKMFNTSYVIDEWTYLEVNIHLIANATNNIRIREEIRVNGNNSRVYAVEWFNITGGSPTYPSLNYVFVDILPNKTIFRNPVVTLRTVYNVESGIVFDFLNVGFIDDYIGTVDLTPPPPPPIDPNANRPYWDMWGWQVVTDETVVVSVGDAEHGGWTYNFDIITSEQVYTKYYYDDSVIDTLNPAELGDWSWVWNWLRDGLTIVINFFIGLLDGIMIALQFLLYLVVLAFNYLIMGLLIGVIAPFFWNTLFYWIWYGVNWLLYYAWQLLLFIGQYLPVIIEALATVFSYVVAALLYILMLGTTDFNSILEIVENTNLALSTFMSDTLMDLIAFLPFLFEYVAFYFVLLGFAWLKYVYAKARGFPKRAEQLRVIYESYLSLVYVVKNIIVELKNILAGWL